MSTSAALGLAVGNEEACDRLVHRAADEGTPEVLDDLVPDGLGPGTRLAAGCWVRGEVGHPGGVGPGGVERRQERRWN